MPETPETPRTHPLDPDYIEPVSAEGLNELAPAQLHEDDCTGEPEADDDGWRDDDGDAR